MLNTQTNGTSKVRLFDKTPLYEQVGDVVRKQILAGMWKIDTAIPPEPDLARDFGVSAGTMRKALDMLEAEGLLVRIQGKGTFIVDKAAADQQRMQGCRLKALELIEGNVSKTIIKERVARALFEAGADFS